MRYEEEADAKPFVVVEVVHKVCGTVNVYVFAGLYVLLVASLPQIYICNTAVEIFFADQEVLFVT